MTPPFKTDAGAQSWGREIGLNVQSASPPVDAYIGRDDTLNIFLANSLNGLNVNILARILLPDGRIIPSQWILTPLATRTVQPFTFNLPECFLLSLTMFTNIGGGPGICYAEAMIGRGSAASGLLFQVLCKGYITGDVPISWPGGLQTTNTDGRGNIRSINNGAPGAGNESSVTVPAGALWRPITFCAFFQSSATVASRVPSLVLDDGANIFSRVEIAQIIGANSGALITWGVNLPQQNAVGVALIAALPNQLFMLPGFRLRTVTNAIQVNDNYTSSQLLVEEWLLP